MNKKSPELNAKAFAEAILYLLPFGWLPCNDMWKFKKNDRIYDLSAADLTKHEMIEKKGLFLCG